LAPALLFIVKTSILDILDIEPAKPAQVLGDDIKKMVLLMIAIGEPSEQVAAKFRLSKDIVDALIRSKDGTEQILRMQTALFPDAQVRIKKLAHLAVDQQVRLMLTAKSEGVRARVATDMLDRSIGKAVQVIETRNIAMAGMDLQATDHALRAQEERLARLEAVQKRLDKASVQ